MGTSSPNRATPPSLPRTSSSRSPLLWIVIAILLVPPAALIVLYSYFRISNRSEIHKLEAGVRKRGEPLTLAELRAKYPPIPDGENAAIPLIAIWTKEDPVFWQAFADGERSLPERVVEKYDPALPYLGSAAQRIPRGGPLDSNSLTAADFYLGTNASYMEQVRAALKRPRAWFNVNIEDGPNALLPHLPMLKTEAQRFRIVALVAAERGDSQKAIAALKDVSRAGRILADEPILISQLIRVACVSMVLDGAERLLSRQTLEAGQLNDLRKLVEDINLHGVARFSLASERPFSLCVFNPEIAARVATSNPSYDDSDNSGQTQQNVRNGFRILGTIGYLDQDKRLMLATLNEAIALAGEETPESLKKIDKLFDETQTNALKFPPKMFSAMMLPSLQKVSARFAAYEARRRAALIAVAVEHHRLDHEGNIPEKLVALVPAYLSSVPTDPFDGQELRFRKTERGFEVYSVGRDREDNGGKEQTRGSVEHTDITFFVER